MITAVCRYLPEGRVTAKWLSAALTEAHAKGAQELTVERRDGLTLAIFALRFASPCYRMCEMVEGGDWWDWAHRPGGSSTLLADGVGEKAITAANKAIFAKAAAAYSAPRKAYLALRGGAA